MRILEDFSERYGCEYCDETFFYKTSCREHEAACPERDIELSGFQIEDLT